MTPDELTIIRLEAAAAWSLLAVIQAAERTAYAAFGFDDPVTVTLRAVEVEARTKWCDLNSLLNEAEKEFAIEKAVCKLIGREAV